MTSQWNCLFLVTWTSSIKGELEQVENGIDRTRKLRDLYSIPGHLKDWRSSTFQQPAFAIPNPRPSQRESQVRDALECYSVFSEGARTDGPDFTPADWGAVVPLQDIPWSQLAWVCSLGRPLDLIPTSHIQRVRLAFIHCLQAVNDSPNKEHVWKRVCLLPTTLFIDIGKCRRADLDAKVEIILSNCWPFKVGDFPGRMEKKVQVKDNRSQLAGVAPSPTGAGNRVY